MARNNLPNTTVEHKITNVTGYSFKYTDVRYTSDIDLSVSSKIVTLWEKAPPPELF